ncbi:hypothetical protein CAEBREN_02825 [Caenorhabditis brenneri]|uniref:G-protein coupled receptors family 1 profile domain-containing protein n=1 Tax=Caenorhabditis brenneri TaxID=135651 RepID=G0NN20_CAEBE|nr:hypothetical protein CAEBREN_02825 [Caenorhabditis brenneri]
MLSIYGVPEYIVFEYKLNWITIAVLIALLYSIICSLVFFKIIVLSLEKSKQNEKNGLRQEIIASFILMQSTNILLIISEFLVIRLPLTTLFTSYFALNSPQSLMKSILFFHYIMFHSSQLLTVLFCGLRVSILYSIRDSIIKKAIKILPIIIFIIGFLTAFPHFSSGADCVQANFPFNFGSLLIVSLFFASNPRFASIQVMSFISFSSISILIFSWLMFKKIQEGKKLSFQKSSAQSVKVERTLTVTVVILLIPFLLYFLIAMLVLLGAGRIPPGILSYIPSLRSILLDARTHVATLYFYFTHPMFKTAKGRICPQTLNS